MKNSQKLATMNIQSKEPPTGIIIINIKVGTNKRRDNSRAFDSVKEDCRLFKVDCDNCDSTRLMQADSRRLFDSVKEDCRLSKILKPFKRDCDSAALLQADSRRLFELVQEYCRLSKLLQPSERDIDKIAAILELAQYDAELNCLINEADRLIAYELELQSGDWRI